MNNEIGSFYFPDHLAYNLSDGEEDLPLCTLPCTEFHSNILADVTEKYVTKKSYHPDPYATCKQLIDALSHFGDPIPHFLYSKCLPLLKASLNYLGVIGTVQLQAMFSQERVKELNAFLKWHLLFHYAEVVNEQGVQTGFKEIKQFLGIQTLSQILTDSALTISDSSSLTLDQFLKSLEPFFGLEQHHGNLDSNLQFIFAMDLERLVESHGNLFKILKEVHFQDTELAESCLEVLSRESFGVRVRFALLINIFYKQLKNKNEIFNAILELDACTDIFEPPMLDLLIQLRKLVVEKKFSTSKKQHSDFKSPMMPLPKYAKLNSPNHPNWMPNGGNTCYISATLWPLFLLLNPQIKVKLEQFEIAAQENSYYQIPEIKEAREVFASLYKKISAVKIEDIEVKDVNAMRRALQKSLPDQFLPNTYTPEDACEFLVWVMNDLLELCVTSKNDPKFSVLHTFCATSDGPLLDDLDYDYNEALAPSYNSQPSYILDLRLDEGKVHRISMKDFVTRSRQTEIIQRNAYKKEVTQGLKQYQSFPAHHNEQLLVESKETAPQFFVGRVTRFTLDFEHNVKRKRFDQICPNASLGFKIIGKEEEDETVQYDLIAMTVHKGDAIDHGHYYCYFRQEVELGQWKFYKYDDIEGPSYCNDEKKVMQDATTNGYLFYYRKREEGALPPPPLPFEDILELQDIGPNENESFIIPESAFSDDAIAKSLALLQQGLETNENFPSIYETLKGGEGVVETSASVEELYEVFQWLEENIPEQFLIEEESNYFSNHSELMRRFHLQILSENMEFHILASTLERPIYLLDPSRDEDLIVLEQQIAIPGELCRFGEEYTGEIFYLFRLKNGAFVNINKM